MARTITEREALAEVYGRITSALNGGDIRVNFNENDAPDMSEDDAAYINDIMDRVQGQMQRKHETYSKPK